MKREPLFRRVARIIDPTAYALSPSTYGLRTEKELRDHTLAGAGQRIAEDCARKILRVIRREMIKDMMKSRRRRSS